MSEEEKKQFSSLKNKFNLVICADFQMCKLVPYWGISAQPGSTTYYLQKLNHDVFGIVNHASNSSTVYLFDERVWPKHSHHTPYPSSLTGYSIYTCFWTIHPVLIKTFMAMASANEMIEQRRLSFLRIFFLITSHTKFFARSKIA